MSAFHEKINTCLLSSFVNSGRKKNLLGRYKEKPHELLINFRVSHGLENNGLESHQVPKSKSVKPILYPVKN